MNIVLTGYAGTGKTVVGKVVAEKLARTFVDINEVVERREKDRIARINQVKGQAYLDEKEAEVVAEISGQDNLVIATGARTLLNEVNFRNLKKNGLIVCLTAEPSLLLLRTVSPLKERAVLLKSKQAIETVRQVMKERELHYSKADHTIDTSELTVEQVADKVILLGSPG